MTALEQHRESVRRCRARNRAKYNANARNAWAKRNASTDDLREKQRNFTRRRPELKMLYAAKERAKKAGVEFALCEADIKIPEVCPVLGVKLVRHVGKRADDSPTLDRRDPRKGYVRGNVTVISYRANRIKNDATTDELRRLVQWLERNENE